jgi:hypothetical protein
MLYGARVVFKGRAETTRSRKRHAPFLGLTDQVSNNREASRRIPGKLDDFCSFKKYY